ncbi:MAG: hypothetical protein R3E21_01595 [Caenibius sp.]
MACFATPYGLRYAAHCFNRAYAQNNRPALIPAGGKLGVTSPEKATRIGKSVNVRERNKEARRDRILSSAEHLIEQHGSTNFSMIELARVSRLAVQTHYNLFNSKHSIIFGVLNKVLDDIIVSIDLRGGRADPIERVFAYSESAVNIYLDRPVFFHSIFRHIFGIEDESSRLTFNQRAYDYWEEAVGAIYTEYDDVAIAPAVLADTINLYFVGVLESWIHRELSSVQFRAKISRGIAVQLLALNLPDTRERLLKVIADGSELI